MKLLKSTAVLLSLLIITMLGAPPANSAEDRIECEIVKSVYSPVSVDRCNVYSSYRVYDDGTMSRGNRYIDGLLRNTSGDNAMVSSIRLEFLDVSDRILETKTYILSPFNEFTHNKILRKNEYAPFSSLMSVSPSISRDVVKVKVSIDSRYANSKGAVLAKIYSLKSQCKAGQRLGEGVCNTSFKVKNTSSKTRYLKYSISYFNEYNQIVGVFTGTKQVKGKKTITIKSNRAIFPILPQYKDVVVLAYFL